jgi:hypothetical protein
MPSAVKGREGALDSIIAFCGLTCTECPAHMATQDDDDEARQRVAEKWSLDYGSDVKPEDINCDGCLPGKERYFSHCSQCEIRACGVVRGVENCAHCPEYACEKLEPFLQAVPAARAELDRIHGSL